jgi:hypothetical protein
LIKGIQFVRKVFRTEIVAAKNRDGVARLMKPTMEKMNLMSTSYAAEKYFTTMSQVDAVKFAQKGSSQSILAKPTLSRP